MELLSQEMKEEMERCKRLAREAGLQFSDNTLEYIISNRDMLVLSPKIMIPSLYDYWVHDVGAIQQQRMYDAFPHNPYETVINTRPSISFYNQDNTDWFNVMIFYHVLGHIDFFQNNVFFRNTWDDDFYGQALADKRLLNNIRQEMGSEKRWVDYVIEFSRAIDNLVGYYPELEEAGRKDSPSIFGESSERVNFYFSTFLKQLYDDGKIELKVYYDEIDRFNRYVDEQGEEEGEKAFFEDNYIKGKFPEFKSTFKKWKEKKHKKKPRDIFEYLWQNSEVLNREENSWMKDVMHVVRRTSLYFQPQIRTKICNEGWASFWHQRMFVSDERIETHETEYARVDSGVTALPRMGVNPYAIGMRLFEFIEDMARKGKLSSEYQLLKGIEDRENYDRQRGDEYARQVLLDARKYLNDELLIDFLSKEDFQDFVDRYRLFVIGVRPHSERWDKVEYYIKSKNGEDYRELIKKQLYHPPHIEINEDKAKDGELYLDHVYEGRALNAKQISSVLIGLEYLWGKRVSLETTEYQEVMPTNWWEWYYIGYKPEYRVVRVRYSCEDKRVEREVL